MYCTLVLEVKRGQIDLMSKQINNTKRCSNIYEALESAIEIGLSHFFVLLHYLHRNLFIAQQHP